MKRWLVVIALALVALGVALALVFDRDRSHPAAPPPLPYASPSPSAPAAPSLPPDPVAFGAPADAAAAAPAPAPPPPPGRTLDPAIVHGVTDQLRELAHQCMAVMPPGMRGSAPRLHATLLVSIKDHRLSVGHAIITMLGMRPDAAARIRQCLEQRAVGIAADASGERDGDAISLPVDFAAP